MTDSKINSLLDEGNNIFLQGKFNEAIGYYDKIIDENSLHASALNNKGYALSKLKNYDGAMKCYNDALKIFPEDLALLVNKISLLRKQGNYVDALSICNSILIKNPKYNTVLYHKERILLSMGMFEESISCCDMILDDYPENADVLFDKSCSLAMLFQNDESFNFLERAISHGMKYKSKAKKSKSFEKLLSEPKFQNLLT